MVAGVSASYKERLLQYNRDDCAALRRVTEFVETIILRKLQAFLRRRRALFIRVRFRKIRTRAPCLEKSHSPWRNFQELMNAHISITSTTASLLVIVRHIPVERGTYEGLKIYREE